ncbi:MAG: phospholipase D-like domain-containing protein [Solirubrobacteraceae bacterium]
MTRSAGGIRAQSSEDATGASEGATRASPVTGASPATEPAQGGLSLITEPGPGDEPFVVLIDSARHTVRIAVYELEDRRVEQALADAAARGVRVMVLLDDGRYGAGRPSNLPAYSYLSAHHVIVSWAPTDFALLHEKAIVIDRRVAAIMTMNLTPGYYSSSRDFAVLDRRPADVAAIERVFDADLAGRQIAPGAGSGDLVWSPGAQKPIVALIARARHSLELENEEMDDPAATIELCEDARRGVRVRVVMTYQPAWRAAFAYLTGCGVLVRTYTATASLYIHAKLIRVDRRIVFLGSQNLSRQSLDYNRELGILTEDPEIVAGTGRAFNGDFTGAQPYLP